MEDEEKDEGEQQKKKKGKKNKSKKRKSEGAADDAKVRKVVVLLEFCWLICVLEQAKHGHSIGLKQPTV